MSDRSAAETIAGLLADVERASGADAALDAAIHEALGEAGASPGNPGDSDLEDNPDATPPPVTGSVDRCLDLLARVLPGWHWHVGHGPDGILPYASLSRGDARFESGAPTVPLALLRAMLRAMLPRGPGGPRDEATDC